MYTDQQIRDFFATNPDNNAISAAARAGGLNVDQIAQALAVGRGVDPNQNPGIYSSMVGDALNMTGNVNPGVNGTQMAMGDRYRGFKGTDTFVNGEDPSSPTNSASGGSGTSSPYPYGSDSGASSSYSGGGINPYLNSMADDIARRSNLGLGQALQGIQGRAIGVGGLGGSRQGVAQGQAIGLANDTLTGNLANLYGNSWNAGENRNLQAYGIDKNAAVTTNGQNQNFYTNNRQLDQSGIRLGADLYSQGNAGNLSQGSGVAQLGTQEQNANQSVYDNINSNISPYTGFGATNTSTNTSGGGVNGAAGGALAAMQIGRNLGFSNGNSGTPSGWENYSTGQANNLGNYYS